MFCIATAITAALRISNPAMNKAEEYIDLERADIIAQYLGHIVVYIAAAPVIFVALITNSEKFIDILSLEIIKFYHG